VCDGFAFFDDYLQAEWVQIVARTAIRRAPLKRKYNTLFDPCCLIDDWQLGASLHALQCEVDCVAVC